MHPACARCYLRRDGGVTPSHERGPAHGLRVLPGILTPTTESRLRSAGVGGPGRCGRDPGRGATGSPDGDDEASAAAFGALAERIEDIAESSRESGDAAALGTPTSEPPRTTRRNSSLWSQADDAIPQRAFTTIAAVGTPSPTSMTRRSRGSTSRESASLPGYFLGVDGSKRPTLVLINGSDGALTWSGRRCWRRTGAVSTRSSSMGRVSSRCSSSGGAVPS